MTTEEKIKAYRDRMADESMRNSYYGAHEINALRRYYIDGFSAALELGKALGRAEALDCAAMLKGSE